MSNPLFPVVPKKVVIIGAGAAGVFTAYLMKKFAPGCFDITLLERGDKVGGHTLSFQKSGGGETVNIDGGAQFFSETAQPEYCAMLRREGFFDVPGRIIERDIGITIWDQTNSQVLFRVPSTLSGIFAAALADVRTWLNFLSLTKCAILQYRFGGWGETFGAWLDTVPLLGNSGQKAAFKADIARPLMYQFGLVKPADLDALSAKFVVYYYVRSLPWLGGSSPFKVYNSDIGLDGVLRELLDMYGIVPTLNAHVAAVDQDGAGYKVRLDDGTLFQADEVVYAVNPQWLGPLLPSDSSFDPVRGLVAGMNYLSVPVYVQDTYTPNHMPTSAADWSVSNVLVAKDGGGVPTNYMLSVWFGPLRTQSIAATCFKSWGTPSLVNPPPDSNDLKQVHRLMVGTPDFIARRQTLRSAYQGQNHLWYAGGYIVDYDCQNAALRSAAHVARQLVYNCILSAFTGSIPLSNLSSQTAAASGRPGLPGRESLSDQEPSESLREAQFKESPALLEEIERVIVERSPRDPAVREWLDQKRQRGMRQP